MTADWKIREGSPDWECDWKANELFHLRYFRALSVSDKLRAVENMCETADYFRRKAEERKRSGGATGGRSQ